MKINWWLVGGIFFIVVGVLQLLQTLGGEWNFWSLYGPAYILLGIGIIKKMRQAFWVTLALALMSFLQPIVVSLGGGESTGFSLFDIVGLVILTILWFQMRKEK